MILGVRAKFAELDKLRIDFVVQEAFDQEFAATESSQFVSLLKSKIPELASVHTGDNWRFGKGRLGDVKLLESLAREAGVEAEALECLYLDGERVSSTRIRNALQEGRIEEANRLLGYEYESFGVVTEGQRMGRTIGVPTLNLPFDGDLQPKYGVYAARVSSESGGEQLKGVANFGIRPTVNSLEAPLLEVHVLEECPFTYGDRVRVEWARFLRAERKFDSVERLKEQIESDIRTASDFFEEG